MTIVLVIIGIFLLFKQSVSLSNTSELRRPRTVVVGIITIIAGILASIIANKIDPQSKMDVIVYVSAFLIPLIVIPFLKQQKLLPVQGDIKTSNKIITILGWLVLLGVVGFLVWLMMSIK